MQDTLLRAVRRPPHDRGRLAAWLTTVLKNRLRSRHLAERRRHDRERAVARDAATVDRPERFDVCKRVVAAVDRLSAADRAVVTMRYFDDLPPRVIGERLGLPVNTVRSRLRRALRKLRNELDRSHGGDRGVWIASLAAFGDVGRVPPPIAPPAPTPAPPTLWPTVVHGVAVMHSKTKLTAIVVLVLGITVALAWSLSGGRDRPDPDAGEGAARSAVASSSGTDDRSGAGDARSDASEAAERRQVDDEGWRVRGVAVRQDGSRASGVALAACVFDGALATGEPAREVVVRTDELGSFAWSSRPPESTAALVFRSDDERWVCPDRTWILPGGRAPTGEIVVRLIEVDAAIEGTVTDDDGRPVAGAVVRVGDALTITLIDGVSATTGVDGSYRVRTPSRGGLTAMVVMADGYAHESARLPAPRPGRSARRDFVLQRGARVFGRIVDHEGAPLSGASVRASHSYQSSVVTDADGRYEITNLDLRHEYDIVFASHPTHYGFGRRITLDRDEQQLDLTLRPAFTLTGRVRDESGGAIEGALVFTTDDSLENGRPDAVTGRGGGFELRGVRPGIEFLVVRAEGYGMAVLDMDLEPDDSELAESEAPDPIEVVLRAGRRVSGMVADRHGRPLAEVSVLCDLSATTSVGMHMGTVAHTGADGRFDLGGLPATPVSLTFAKAGYQRAERCNLTADGLQLHVGLQRSAGIAGRVVDGVTGEPIPEFTIRLVPVPLAPGQRGAGSYARAWVYGLDFVDDRGEWSTDQEELAEGGFVGVQARAGGYGPSEPIAVQTRVDPAPGDTVIRLWPGSTLRGTVRAGDTGRPIAGAVVFLFESAERVADLQDSWGPEGFIPRVRTDEAGAFAFDGVRGTVTLGVRHDDYALLVDGPFDVPADPGGIEHAVTLHPGVAVRGRVVDADGRPRPRSLVNLVVSDDRVVRARTDGDGRFLFERQGPGRYTLRSVAGRGDDRWFPLQRVVTVDGDRDVEIDLDPREGSARLRCEIRLTSVDGVTATLRRIEPGGLERTQRARGRELEFSGLKLGMHEIVVVGSTWRRTRRVEISAGANEIVVE